MRRPWVRVPPPAPRSRLVAASCFNSQVVRVAAVALLAVAMQPSAEATRTALEVRLTVKPSSPRALEPARIELRTYLPLLRADGSCCRLEPGGPVAYPFRIEATSPAGKRLRVRVAKSQANLWQGNFRFPLPGRWLVRVVNSDVPNPLPGARPRLWVRIRPAASDARDVSSCTAASTRTAVSAFVASFNRGDFTRLDAIFAPEPSFQWYSSGTPGSRIRAASHNRTTLRSYFQTRHAKRDRLRVVSLRFTGKAAGHGTVPAHGNFSVVLKRSAADYRQGAWFGVIGKGAVVCSANPAASRFIVFSLGGPGSARAGFNSPIACSALTKRAPAPARGRPTARRRLPDRR
jgi:hypothetical protein